MHKNKMVCLFISTALLVLGIEFIYAKPKTPDGLCMHSAIYDSANKQMVVFGGSTNKQGLRSDVWTFDLDKKIWGKIKTKKTPPPQFAHSAIYDSENKQMIILGGNIEGKYLSDIWAFDIEKKSWNKIKTDNYPAVDGGFSCIYDSNNKKMLIFGGSTMSGLLSSDIWAFDVEKKTWKEIEADEAPPPRYSPSAIYDPVGKQVLLFGGHSNDGTLSDLWFFDVEKKLWQEKEIDKDEVPPGRTYHTAVYDSINKQMIIFGGSGQGGPMCDTWTFDIATKKWKEIETDKAPPARIQHSAIYDPVGKQMIIFGGNGGIKGFLSDLWAFDTEKKIWQKLKTKFEQEERHEK